MRLLVGYVVHEVTSDLTECMCLSLTSLQACTTADVIVFCRQDVANALPQLGVNVCIVNPRTDGETLELGAASHPIVIDHGGDALMLLEPTTLVLKDIARDAGEMRSLPVAGVPYEKVGRDIPIINSLSHNAPLGNELLERGSMPLILTPSANFASNPHKVHRWICGYSYSFAEGGWNTTKGSRPGLCTTRGLSEMARAMRAFQSQCLERDDRIVLPRISEGSEGSKGSMSSPCPLHYYAVLLESRPERVVMVDKMRVGCLVWCL